MASNTTPTTKPGLSLYANLLDPTKNVPGTISSAPVTYNKPSEPSPEDEATKKQQALAASLRFQPTKRPQLAAQKAKAKAIASKLSTLPKSTEPQQSKLDAEKVGEVIPAISTNPTAQKTTAADWIATASDDEDVNAYYAGSRQRGGRKKRKKNKEAAQVVQYDWDDIYDPTRPNHYEEYKYSEEKIREVREWKDLLYRHRMRRRSSDSASDSDRSRGRQRNKQFAPPSSMSFAPPQHFDTPSMSVEEQEDDDEYVPPSPAAVPDDLTGEDAFARRMRMSGMPKMPPPPSPPPPPPSDMPKPPAGQIARAPVRYNLPLPDPELPSNETELQEMEVDNPPDDEAPRSLRPGQAKFAERLMAKYGWSKGQGLGKESTGVTTALYAKVDKRKKKSDAEGGGFATPAATGRILGGKQSEIGKAAEEGKFGAMSEIVRLQGMLKGMDLQAEMTNEQGGLMQEIGEECSEKYGNVERVYIHPDTNDENGALVFVHFTNQLSALRAVNALEGRVFNGNEIKARFWQKEKFERGDFE